MKLFVILALIAAAIASPDDTYDSKYENLDIDEIINNESLFKGYLQCFHGTGPCTGEGKNINGLIPEAVNTSCAKCSEKQRTIVAKGINAAKVKFPKEYEEIVAKYDPEGKRASEIAAFIAKYSA